MLAPLPRDSSVFLDFGSAQAPRENNEPSLKDKSDK